MKSFLIARAVLRPFLKFFFRYKVENTENIPDTAYVVCANHVSLRDPFCVACSLPGAIRFVCKSEFKKNPVLRGLLNIAKVIFINRASADLGSIRTCVDTVKAGVNVAIFPQGTRVKEQAKPEQTQDGIAMICALTKAPVLPVALIYESYKPRLFTRCRVVLGKPVYPDEYKGLGSRAEQSRYIFGKVCEIIDNDKH